MKGDASHMGQRAIFDAGPFCFYRVRFTAIYGVVIANNRGSLGSFFQTHTRSLIPAIYPLVKGNNNNNSAAIMRMESQQGARIERKCASLLLLSTFTTSLGTE